MRGLGTVSSAIPRGALARSIAAARSFASSLQAILELGQFLAQPIDLDLVHGGLVLQLQHAALEIGELLLDLARSASAQAELATTRRQQQEGWE